jgi:histidine triad (HIT) family protein
VHVLIIPMQHIESLAAATPADKPLLGHMLGLAPQIAALAGIDRSGYRTVVNTGRDAGMAVYHLHVHVLGGRRMAWPPG